MIGRCPLCGSEGVEHPGTLHVYDGASCSNGRCILYIGYQDDTNCHVLLSQWPKPCIFEARAEDGRMAMGGTTRAWCQVHGFDCPSMSPSRNRRSR